MFILVFWVNFVIEINKEGVEDIGVKGGYY